MWEKAGALETLGEDIMALEAHQLELDKGRQSTRLAKRELSKQSGGGQVWAMSDVGIFVGTSVAESLANLTAEQQRIEALITKNRGEIKEKTIQLATLENNEELLKRALEHNLKPMDKDEANFDPNNE